MTKEQIRAQIQSKTATPEEHQALVENVRTLNIFQTAKTIGVYMPLPDEPDIRTLFELPGKRFFIPAFDEKRHAYFMTPLTGALKKGKFGIPEPADPIRVDTLDLILAPGTAFDRSGNRLGRGGGFYDSILAEYPAATTVGLCFNDQLFASLPVEPHDRPVDWIITETQILESSHSGR